MSLFTRCSGVVPSCLGVITPGLAIVSMPASA
jgi:hypothetical protein